MTGGIGFTTLMRGLTRGNRDHLKHTDKFKERSHNKKDEMVSDKKGIRSADISEDELNRLKISIREKRLKERKRSLIKSVIITLFIAVLFVVLYNL